VSDIATRLRELADLRAAATEGPWRSEEDGCLDLFTEEPLWHVFVPTYDGDGECAHPVRRDAAFIAAAGSLTPAQLRAVADVVEAARIATDRNHPALQDGIGSTTRHVRALAAALAALDQAGGKE